MQISSFVNMFLSQNAFPQGCVLPQSIEPLSKQVRKYTTRSILLSVIHYLVWHFNRDRARCIDLRLIETDADQTTLKPYQKLSLLNPPAEYRTQFISSSYKLDLNLQFWRGDVERANGLRQLFPLKYMVVGTCSCMPRLSPVCQPLFALFRQHKDDTRTAFASRSADKLLGRLHRQSPLSKNISRRGHCQLYAYQRRP